MIGSRRDIRQIERLKQLEEGLLALKPGFGCEELHLGQTEQQVVELLGLPEKVTRDLPDSYYYEYRAHGIDLDFGAKREPLKIIFFRSSRNKDALSLSARIGTVRLGSSRSEVLRQFGQPDQSGEGFVLSSGEYKGAWLYFTEGMQFDLDSSEHVETMSISSAEKS